VEKKVSKYTPNFTIPDNQDIPIKKAGKTVLASSLALSALSIANPISLLVGAAIATPSLYKALSTGDEKEAIDDESLKELQEYVDNHSLSKEEALELDFCFPPAHPLVGETYRLHPLSAHKDSAKAKLYIPESSFDDILLEERESELLKLLVYLGATEVEISKHVESLIDDRKSGSIGAGVDSVADAQLNAAATQSSDIHHKNTRMFTLSGKPWKYGDVLDRTNYAWLKFEPTWDALITAREIGGCTSAALEIKESSKYIANKEVSMQLKAKIYSANGSINLMSKDLQNTSYVVKVKFSNPTVS